VERKEPQRQREKKRVLILIKVIYKNMQNCASGPFFATATFSPSAKGDDDMRTFESLIDLQQAYRRSAACLRGDIDQDEADELAAALQRQMVLAEETYIERLRAKEEEVGPGTNKASRDLAARLRALQDTITTLQEEHERE
jgi:hypothetical protein